MAKRKPNTPPDPELIRTVGLACILLLGVAMAWMSLVSFVRSSALFTVKDVSFADSIQSFEFPDLLKLKGQNLLFVDLAKVEARVQARYPQLADLRVMRRFPDQIFVTAIRRDPFSLALFDGKGVVIDRNGYIIGAPQPGQGELPVIKGLRRQKIATGEKVQDARVKMASGIILAFHQDSRFSGVRLVAVNVDDAARIVCGLDHENTVFDVIIDKDNIPARLNTLAEVLARGGLDLVQVKYIDLRFGEPVIGQKKGKK